MLEIRKTIIDEAIAHVKFACNVSACKGACCTLAGGTGAPLLDEEREQIDRAFPVIRSSLPQEHLNTIARRGLYDGESGSYTTICYNNRACVFVLYENGIARCAFEKAFHEGTLKWRKPLSCHLFPIRVSRGVSELLRYERLAECVDALVRGENEKIYLSTFLKEPLIRAYGSAWYEDFQLTCNWERNEYGNSERDMKT